MSDVDLSRLLTGPVLEVAPMLLGARLGHTTEDGTVVVRLTEVEAYDGAEDPGSHAYRGPTPRNEVMFGPAGHLYTYLIYGMHVCANLVTGAEGRASAVLLRAGEVVEGADLARHRRGASTSDRDLARGPGRLCRALGISLAHDGHALAPELPTDEGIGLELPAGRDPAISTGPRVGLRAAADRPWRFWVTGDRSVSDYRPAKRR